MDPKRYERIRDLFLAVEELPPGEQEAFLRQHAAGDVALYQEVLTLLVEHDPAAACSEGENVEAVQLPSSADTTSKSVPPPTESDDQDRRAAQGVWTPADRSRSVGNKRDTPGPRPEVDTAEGTSTSVNRSTEQEIERQGLVTKSPAMRTHASPRYDDSHSSDPGSRQLPIWGERTRKERRRTSAWLWVAALVPTALIGWWTYFAVSSAIRDSVEMNLIGASENVSFSVNQFLSDQVNQVEAWSRQPAVKQSIIDLAALAASDPPLDRLRQSPLIETIHRRLAELSEDDGVRFIAWNVSSHVIASSTADRSDIGDRVHPDAAGDLTRVMTGTSVLYGPMRCSQREPCVFPARSEPTKPQMAFIVPIENEGKIIAALMVQRDSTFQQFQELFSRFSGTSDLDAYLVDREGVMVNRSLHALFLANQNRLDVAADEVAGRLRVSDPGQVITRQNRRSIRRQICPVTLAVAGVQDRIPGALSDPYSNYAGESVVGAWRWLSRWQLGVIVEEKEEDAFAPARLVRFSFLLLGSVLFVTGSLAATLLSRASAAEKAAVHPLSRYEVLGELGSGGMGMVYRARHRQLGRDVALKVLRADRQTSDDRARFDREARLAASLTNPHSVKIYDYGHSDQNEAFCVMQHLEGLTLQEVVSRSGYQPIGRVLAIIRQICDPLAEAHGMNLLHRDIKPQNIMLSLDNAVGDWAVLFDFGLAKPLEPDAGVYQTTEKLWSGTPMYMAPERFRDPSSMDPRSDIYSVGCIAYYLLSGRPPFIESDPESLFSLILSEQPLGITIHRGEDVDPELSEIVFRCMAKNAQDRYATAVELGRAIDSLRVKYPWEIDSARVWWSHHGAD